MQGSFSAALHEGQGLMADGSGVCSRPLHNDQEDRRDHASDTQAAEIDPARIEITPEDVCQIGNIVEDHANNDQTDPKIRVLQRGSPSGPNHETM